jgi:hypothetical protein
MQIFKNGQVAHYKQMFPNTSFPASGPSDEFLASAGAYKVSVFRPYDKATQKLVPCDPVVEDGFAYVVAVEDKTAEEIAADTASKAAKVRAQRDQLIAQSDWMVVRAQETNTQVAEEWVTYRQALRDITSQESFPDVTWPVSPDAPQEQPE